MNEQTERLLVDSDEAAAMCGISRTMWWGLHSSGRVPAPVRLGRRTLWSVEELRGWIGAGCPARERWLAQGDAEKRVHRVRLKNSAGNTT
ncbi:MAG TPA: hypothetical protein VM487_18120 [Phycisphaerae bacterium]|nr:hypothetical protein [Phycisphaerae bacterium]